MLRRRLKRPITWAGGVMHNPLTTITMPCRPLATENMHASPGVYLPPGSRRWPRACAVLRLDLENATQSIGRWYVYGLKSGDCRPPRATSHFPWLDGRKRCAVHRWWAINI